MEGFEFVAWNGNNQIELRTADHKSAATISRTSASWKLVTAGD
jgi:hypothetical protein